MTPPESGIRLIKRCPGCNRQWYSRWTDAPHLIGEKQWDGSDFFTIWPLSGFYVTDRVAQFILRNKLGPAKLVPLEQMQWPKYVPDLAPGRLRDWYPEERARALGESLGIH